MKYRYKLLNLDCANCANKIEEYLNRDSNLNNVSVNYSKASIVIETELKDDIKKYLTKKIAEVEPEIKLIETTMSIDNKRLLYSKIIKLLLGIIISIIGLKVHNSTISTILIILGYLILLSNVIINAFQLLIKSHTINENLLITISCLGAYFTDNIKEGLMVIILYEIGKILEQLAINNSRKSITNLLDIKSDYANLKQNNKITKVNPHTIKKNDIIVVKKGERIPLDGIITSGQSKLNTSALTGESKLQQVKENDLVYSGCINNGSVIEIKVTSDYENSMASKILDLVENATDRKAKTENFISKTSKIYTPIVITLAIIVLVTFPFIFRIGFKESLYRSLIFLVISCPCAIAISVPLCYFSGIGIASKNGIIIKGSDYLDSLRLVTKIIFDKTGTITTGNFNDYELTIYDKKVEKKEVINYFLQGENLSSHPLAKSIINLFKEYSSPQVVKSIKEFPGQGISYNLSSKKIMIGNAQFVENDSLDNAIYLKINKKIIARLELVDSIKEDSIKTIEYLKKMNIKTYIYTGDEKVIAEKVAKKVNVDSLKYELLPDDKYRLLQQEIINNKGGKVMFVGDGINDAPSLALADIGVGMGGIGSAEAIEASDVVITTDELSKIVSSIKIAKKTHKIVVENLIFALSIKILILILSTIGLASMWLAVFADTGVTLLTIINTTRILSKKKRTND